MGKKKKNKNKSKKIDEKDSKLPGERRKIYGPFTIDDSFTIPPEVKAMTMEEIDAALKEYEEEVARKHAEEEREKRMDGRHPWRVFFPARRRGRNFSFPVDRGVSK